MTFSLNCAPKLQAKFQSSTPLLQHTLLQVMSVASEACAVSAFVLVQCGGKRHLDAIVLWLLRMMTSLE